MKKSSLLYTLRPGFKAARKAAHLTQQQVADKLSPPVSLKTVMNWEQGVSVPDLETVVKLASLFGCDIDFLTGHISEKTHDLQFIHDQTGLSGDTINTLSEWKNSDDRRRLWPEYLSRLLEDRNGSDLFGYLSDLMGTARLFAEEWNHGPDDSAKQLRIESLWYLSYIFSNMVDRLFAAEIDRIWQEEAK